MTKLEQEKELLEQNRKQQNMINALMNRFASVIGVDFVTEKVVILRTSNRIESALSLIKEQPTYCASIDTEFICS